MRISLFLLLMTLGFSAGAQTTPRGYLLLDKKDLPNRLGSYQHILFSSQKIELYAVTFNETYHGQLYQQKTNDQSLAQSMRDISRSEHSLVSVNGGFYTKNFHPAGLFILDGHMINKLAKDPLLTSCVQVNKKGKIELDNTLKNCSHASQAMQTGPFIIERGHISSNDQLIQKKVPYLKAYFEPHHRTILALSRDKKLLVIITSPATLSEISNILMNYPTMFGLNDIETALNLDGGASTGMYIAFKQYPFYSPEKKSVKTFLLFN